MSTTAIEKHKTLVGAVDVPTEWFSGWFADPEGITNDPTIDFIWGVPGSEEVPTKMVAENIKYYGWHKPGEKYIAPELSIENLTREKES
jgi:hypothetical protein